MESPSTDLSMCYFQPSQHQYQTDQLIQNGTSQKLIEPPQGQSSMDSIFSKIKLQFEVSTNSQAVPRDNNYGFNLEEILLDDDKVKCILQTKIPLGEFIVRADRQAICNLLIDAVIKKLGTSPSKQAMEQLAKHLVSRYPAVGNQKQPDNGWEMYFYYPPYAPSGTGFLQERLKSQRKQLSLKPKHRNTSAALMFESDLDWDSEPELDNHRPEEKSLEYLRQNFGKDLANVMKSTVFQRRMVIRSFLSDSGKILRDSLTSISEIAQKMPRLFDTPSMMTQDFDVRHPLLSLTLYERWPVVSKLLLDYAEKSDINFCKKLGITKSLYEFNEDDTMLVAYCILPLVLPSCGRRLVSQTVDEEEEKEAIEPPKKRGRHRKNQISTVKAPDLDAMKSLIIFMPRMTKVAEILDENKKISPFILALGSTSNLRMQLFYVIIHKLAVPCGSKFLKALDTCLKMFTVLYIPLPVESYNHWTFIQHGVAGKPCEKAQVPPVVQALIGQIMSRC